MATNSAPTFDDTLGGLVTYAVMVQPVILDGSVSVRDAELDALNNGAGDYAGASLLVVRHGGASSGDFFGFSTAGAAFTVSGSLLQSGGQTFATYSAFFGQLAITFTSAGTIATRALVEDVLGHVTYTLTSSAPPATVQIDWRFSDGNTGAQGDGGALLATANTTVALSDPLFSSISTTLPEPLQGLVLTGTGNINGTGNSLANTITGNSGNNSLDGGLGNDVLDGGAGSDTASYASIGAGVTVSLSIVGPQDTGAAGTDTLISIENLTGSAFADTLTGDSKDNILDGRAGIDTMTGGTGNDTYVVDAAADVVIEGPDAGIDTVESSVSCTLPVNVENLVLAGFASINGTGNALANSITGNFGNNLIDGGTGADAMAGGFGNDLYVVDDPGDVVIEASFAGNDTVATHFSYVLGANLENLNLVGTDAVNGTGNALNNILTGNSAANVLAGGLGNDTYVVSDTLDTLVENANEGTDTVQSSATYTLGSNLENLTLTGFVPIDGTGNALDNIITGNLGTNHLFGLDGNDTLNGGPGSDTMTGGTGNDLYMVDEASDQIVENPGEGIDAVKSTVSYFLSANIENLTLTGSANIDGTGNELNNVLTGNDQQFDGAGENVLSGGAGNDSLDGRSGFDTLRGGPGDDTYIINDTMGGATSLTLRSEPGEFIGGGNTYSFNTETGNFVAWDRFDLTGDGQIDFLQFKYEDPVGVVFGGHWFWLGFSTSPLGINLTPGFYPDARVLSFPTPGPVGHPGLQIYGDHRINGQVFGNFTVVAADFDYSGPEVVVRSFSVTFEQHGENPTAPALFGTLNYNYAPAGPMVHDSVIENPNEGTDTVLSSFTHALPANVENLTLTGSTSINGNGNELNNVLIGNAGNNVLLGESGNDSLFGEGGSDTLDGGAGLNVLTGGPGGDMYVVNGPDSLIEHADEGVDSVVSSITFALSPNVEKITLVGGSDIDSTGNDSGNTLIGNSGSNVLAGHAGKDALVGGPGNDFLDGGTEPDVLQGGAGNDTYVVNDLQIAGGPTSLTMKSEPGSVGGGQSYVFDSTTGTFGVDMLLDVDHDGQIDWIRIRYSEPVQFGHFSFLEFSTSRFGTNLKPGYYPDAQRAAFASIGHAGLDVSLDGSGVGEVAGSFTVYTADFDYSGPAPTLRHLLIDFEQHAATLTQPALLGTLSYHNVPQETLVPDAVIENQNEGTDTVMSSVTYTLPANVENLTLTGTAAIDGIGNALANVITGNAGNNTLSGGGGNDTYILNFGFGQDLIIDQDATSGNVDTIRFGSGMTSGAVIVEPVGINDHDIRLSFIGSADAVIMQGWLTSDDSKVERLEFADDVVWGVQNILNRITFHTQNHAPTLATPLADQAATEDAAFSFTVPADAFADVDAGDILSFTATRADGLTLPGWLAFDAATRTLSGTPGAADAGTLQVRVTATDTANANAADVFQLTVTGDEDDHHDDTPKGQRRSGQRRGPAASGTRPQPERWSRHRPGQSGQPPADKRSRPRSSPHR